jgi:hypothetical protein
MLRRRGADAGDLKLDTFNVPMNAISVSVRLRMFSKTAVRFPKFYARRWLEVSRLSPSAVNKSF